MADPITLGTTAMAGISLASTIAGGFTAKAGTDVQQSAADVASAGALLESQGALVQVGGAQKQAEGAVKLSAAESNMWTYRAGVALLNKNIADKNAEYSTAIGEVKAQQSGMATRAQIGATRSAQAAGGLDVRSGSNLAVQESEAELGEYSEATIRSDAAREAFGYKIQGLDYESESDLDKLAASNAIETGNIRAQGYQTEAEGYQIASQADVLKAQGFQFQKAAAATAGTGTILGTLGSASTKALAFNKAGIPGFSFGQSGGTTPSPGPYEAPVSTA